MNNNKLAPQYLRLVAYLIDMLIVWTPGLLMFNWISASTDLNLFLSRSFVLVLFLLYWTFSVFISCLMISVFGGTFGKLLTGTEIVDSQGNHLSFKKAIWRNLFGYTVSGLLLWGGYIWILIDEKRRGWHDMMADSYVVVKNKSFVFLGLASLVLLVYLQISLVVKAVTNFKLNGSVYSAVYDEVQQYIKDSKSADDSTSASQ